MPILDDYEAAAQAAIAAQGLTSSPVDDYEAAAQAAIARTQKSALVPHNEYEAAAQAALRSKSQGTDLGGLVGTIGPNGSFAFGQQDQLAPFDPGAPPPNARRASGSPAYFGSQDVAPSAPATPSPSNQAAITALRAKARALEAEIQTYEPKGLDMTSARQTLAGYYDQLQRMQGITPKAPPADVSKVGSAIGSLMGPQQFQGQFLDEHEDADPIDVGRAQAKALEIQRYGSAPRTFAEYAQRRSQELGDALTKGPADLISMALGNGVIDPSIYTQDIPSRVAQHLGDFGTYMLPVVGQVRMATDLAGIADQATRNPVQTAQAVVSSLNPFASGINTEDRITRATGLALFAAAGLHGAKAMTDANVTAALVRDYGFSPSDAAEIVDGVRAAHSEQNVTVNPGFYGRVVDMIDQLDGGKLKRAAKYVADEMTRPESLTDRLGASTPPGATSAPPFTPSGPSTSGPTAGRFENLEVRPGEDEYTAAAREADAKASQNTETVGTAPGGPSAPPQSTIPVEAPTSLRLEHTHEPIIDDGHVTADLQERLNPASYQGVSAEGMPFTETRMSPEDIGVYPGMQYKKAGITDSTNAVAPWVNGVEKFDQATAGPLTVWQRNDGSTWVMNGHHRRAIALNTNEPDVPVRIFKESDGIDFTMARALGALQNIKDDKGTPLDAATVIRDLGVTPDTLRQYGVNTRSSVGRDALSLLQLDPQALAYVEDGSVPEHVAAGIGDAGLNPERQVAAMREAARSGLETRRAGEILGAKAKTVPLIDKSGGTGDLFGEIPMDLALGEQAKIAELAHRRLTSDKNLYGAMLRGRAVGSTSIDKDAQQHEALVHDTARDVMAYDPTVQRTLEAEAKSYAERPTKAQLDLAVRKVSERARDAAIAKLRSLGVYERGKGGDVGAGSGGGTSPQNAPGAVPDVRGGTGSGSSQSGAASGHQGVPGSERRLSELTPEELAAKSREVPEVGAQRSMDAEFAGQDSLEFSKSPQGSSGEAKRIESFVREALRNKLLQTKIVLGTINEQAAQSVAQLSVEHPLPGAEIIITSDLIRHAFRKHGNEQGGQVSIDPTDFGRVADTINHADKVEHGTTPGVLVFTKAFNGKTMVAVVATNPSNRRTEGLLTVKSIYKHKTGSQVQQPDVDDSAPGRTSETQPRSNDTTESAIAPPGPRRKFMGDPKRGGPQSAKPQPGSGPSTNAGQAPAPAPASKWSSTPMRDRLERLGFVFDNSAKEYGMQRLREMAAEKALFASRAEDAFREMRAELAKRTPEERLDFIDRIENGQPQATMRDQALADFYRAAMDGLRDEVQETGKLQTFIEDYFPHIWADPKEASTWVAKFFGKKPIEGSKAFLKKRTIPTVKEGIDQGLVPLFENPADMIVAKMIEMKRFVLAHKLIEDLRAQGLLTFVRVGAEKPARNSGLVELQDHAFTVHGPNVVTVPEYFDQNLTEALEKFAADNGIDWQRKFSLGRKARGAAGQAVNGDTIMTRHFTPEFVATHEIGHALDYQYDLRDRMAQQLGDVYKAETSDLAALRHDDQAKQGYKDYVQKPAERFANLFHAVIHAPELAEAVAPESSRALRRMLEQIPSVAPILAVKPSVKMGRRMVEVPVAGRRIMGYYYAPEAVGRLINNHLSPGLVSRVPVLNVAAKMNALMTQFKLGISGFHFTTTLLNSMMSSVALGLREVSQGRVGIGAGHVVSGLTPLGPIRNYLEGSKLRKAIFAGPDAFIQNLPVDVQQKLDHLLHAGARIKFDSLFAPNSLNTLRKAIEDKNWGKAALNLVPGVFEWIAKPIMEHWVPSLKLGAFTDLAQSEIARLGPNASQADIDRVLRDAWDSMDNRFGQLTHDNLFWSNTVKQISHLAVLSVGWNLGTIREIGGGILDVPSQIGKGIGRAAGGGKGPARPAGSSPAGITNRTAFTLALVMVVAFVGALYGYLRFHHVPKNVEECFRIPTGKKNADGTRETVVLPTYAKDVSGYAHDPVGTILHKMGPLLQTSIAEMQNKKFYGERIRNEDDSFFRKAADSVKYFAEQSLLPISMSTSQHQKAVTGSSSFENYFGVVSSPTYASRSKALQKAIEIEGEEMSDAPKSHEAVVRQQAKMDIRALAANGQTDEAEKRLAALDLNPGALTKFRKELQDLADHVPFIKTIVSRFDAENAMRVYQLAEGEERDAIQPIVVEKMLRVLKEHPESPEADRVREFAAKHRELQ